MFVEVFITVTMASNSENSQRLGFQIFEDFEKGKYILEDELEILSNYLAGQLNSYWNPNRAFYYKWYSQCGDLFRVIEWRKENGFQGSEKYGERICYTFSRSGALIDLTERKHKDHASVCYSCSKLMEG